MPCKEAVAYFIFKGHPREGVRGTFWDHLQLLHLQEILKVAPISTVKEESKSLYRLRFAKALTQEGTDCLITLVLWSCWSFPKKEMKKLCWGDIFVLDSPRSHGA